MATANKTKGQKEELITALYCRLSVDDDNKDMSRTPLRIKSRFYRTSPVGKAIGTRNSL